MFSKKRLFVPAGLILSSFFGVFAANAQSPQCFNLGKPSGLLCGYRQLWR